MWSNDCHAVRSTYLRNLRMGANHGSGVPSTSVTVYTIIRLRGTRWSLIKSAATACMCCAPQRQTGGFHYFGLGSKSKICPSNTCDCSVMPNKCICVGAKLFWPVIVFSHTCIHLSKSIVLPLFRECVACGLGALGSCLVLPSLSPSPRTHHEHADLLLCSS